MSATRQLAEYVTGMEFARLPRAVVAKCKELLLDAVACGIGGSRTPIGRIVTDFAREIGGFPDARVLGSDLRCACTAAAYANASSINALDYDDTGRAGHPGSSIIAAALALGEKIAADGPALILACVAGYETATRVARAIEPTWERYQQVHGIGTAHTFGSMAACTKLLNLNLEQTLNAFGIAGASAPVAHAGKFGWTDKSIPHVKDNVAWPAEAGLRAAWLAQKGYEGSESILDGERGFWVMAGSDRCDFARLTDVAAYEIVDVSLKPYPCCRWIHTTLDALGEIQKDHSFEPADITAVNVYSNQPLADFFGKTIPRTFVDVEFSVPCAVALKLHKVPYSQWHEPRRWQSPDILALAAKVAVHLDPSYQDLYLALDRGSSRIPSRVEITLKGGQRPSAYADVARGSPQKPMSDAARIAKVRDLMEATVSSAILEEFIRQIEHAEGIHDIRQVLSLL
ncbi:MAG: MmgE/PrpD family protein [Desulfobacterales bacterium]|nr:MAG: MmgE/PrpD family protein [Desulfobacterales bacterium]